MTKRVGEEVSTTWTFQQMLLKRGVDRGGRSAMARWIKAVKAHESHFEAATALGYWRASGDFRAAKALAYQAEPEFLAAIIPELVVNRSGFPGGHFV